MLGLPSGARWIPATYVQQLLSPDFSPSFRNSASGGQKPVIPDCRLFKPMKTVNQSQERWLRSIWLNA